MNSKILALGLTVGCLSLSHSLAKPAPSAIALSALTTPQQPPGSLDSLDPNHQSGVGVASPLENRLPSSSLAQATTKTCSKTKEGYAFPKTTGYIKGYQIKSKTGLSEVTVDNSQNTFDVYVKLYVLSSERPQTIRSFFIEGGQKFTVKNITRGTYDVRYQNLSSCQLFRLDKKFALKQDEKTKNTSVRLTLYGVVEGTVPTKPLDPKDF
jgi:hypothetical protein